MGQRITKPGTYDAWLNEVRVALQEINMGMEDWQSHWRYDFAIDYKAQLDPADAAVKANRFWWHEQNKALGQECQATANCWLPRGHRGECEPLISRTG